MILSPDTGDSTLPCRVTAFVVLIGQMSGWFLYNDETGS